VRNLPERPLGHRPGAVNGFERQNGHPEIDAEFANGAGDTIKRAVSENTSNLGFMTGEWE
jgi:hypothetical protein